MTTFTVENNKQNHSVNHGTYLPYSIITSSNNEKIITINSYQKGNDHLYHESSLKARMNELIEPIILNTIKINNTNYYTPSEVYTITNESYKAYENIIYNTSSTCTYSYDSMKQYFKEQGFAKIYEDFIAEAIKYMRNNFNINIKSHTVNVTQISKTIYTISLTVVITETSTNPNTAIEVPTENPLPISSEYNCQISYGNREDEIADIWLPYVLREEYHITNDVLGVLLSSDSINEAYEIMTREEAYEIMTRE